MSVSIQIPIQEHSHSDPLQMGWSGKVQKFGYYTDLWHEFVSITTKASCQNGCKWKAMSESHAKPYIDWASYDLMLFVPFGSVNHHQLCYWPFMNKLLWKICPKLLFHRHILYFSDDNDLLNDHQQWNKKLLLVWLFQSLSNVIICSLKFFLSNFLVYIVRHQYSTWTIRRWKSSWQRNCPSRPARAFHIQCFSLICEPVAQ